MESSLYFYRIISVVAAFLAVSLGLTLLFLKSKPNRANIYLGLLLLTYSLFYLPGLFDAIGVLNHVPHIIRLNFFAGALVGPFTYLYCKASTHQERLGLKKEVVHFIPFLVSFIWFWPTLIKSGSEKMEIYQTTISEGRVPEPKLVIIVLGLIALVYTIISIKVVSKYLRHLKNTQSNLDLSFYRWLSFLSYSLVLPIVVVLLVTIVSAQVVPVAYSVTILALFVVIIYITLMVRPKFFHGVPTQIPGAATDREELAKYQHSNLKEDQKDKYEARLKSYMENEKPYLNNELTLTEFSNELKIPSHYVSQIINERLEVNFLDFVNQYRIAEVKSKLSNSELNHFTIITLAQESGFNSKTAFYQAFKKNVGSTPSKFRNERQLVSNQAQL